MSVTGKLSIGVVISELTGQFSYSIPVLFACVVGLGAGQLVEIDIYAMIARLKARTGRRFIRRPTSRRP